MGANAVRFVHWQHGEAAYERADELGLVVWTEIPLWGRIAETQAFTNNARQQLEELIRQNYNHPSVMFWGLYNELDDTPAVRTLIQDLHDRAKAEDPTRLTIAATDVEGAQINDIPDVVTYNRYYGWYGDYTKPAEERFDKLTAFLERTDAANGTDRVAIGEYGAGGDPRQHDESPDLPASDPNNALVPQPEEYQAFWHEQSWGRMEAHSPDLWAAFVWQFTDSANDDRLEGSRAGLNTKGLVSHDRRTRKDAYFYYQSQWSDEPVLHLTGERFARREAEVVTVKAYSNMDGPVSLRVNGVTLGTRSDADGVLEWSDVQLVDGENRVEVSGTRDGQTYTDALTWQYDAGGENDGTATGARVTNALGRPAPATSLASSRSPRIASDLFNDDPL